MWLLYELAVVFGFILYLPKALWRRRLPHQGWSMRLGRYPRTVKERLAGRQAIWLHAVSVGEVLAAQPLVRALQAQHGSHPLVVSTVTKSGFEVASRQLNDRGVTIYFPLDLRAMVRRALETIQPRLLLLVESELWPTVIRSAHARRIPMAVVNGRISDRAFPRYRAMKRCIAPVLQQVDLFLMQSQVDADRIMQLGVPPSTVRVTGSLKWDASLGSRPSPAQVQQTAVTLGLHGREPLLVAGSTHRGEEGPILHSLQALRASSPQLRLILAPRHLERLEEIEQLIRQAGWAVVRLSQVHGPSQWDVGLVDTFGQMPRYYAVASIVFIGGSLIPHGGQNPLEAASLGKPIVFGPSMENFSTIAHQLLAHHAARQLTQAGELTPLLQELLADPNAAQAMGQRAQELTERFCGATQRTLEALQEILK